ncbi:hypothetical protein [Vallitalea okinawensis]|uniref:hypothetical protein n=1 Tax=Vallitalea okinawensis TaxID=2078660 RepID=UPI000CFCCC08|nr:hypothetical protein [Vallitalea okinawensis]
MVIFRGCFICFDASNKEIHEINLREEQKDVILKVNEENNSLDVYYRNNDKLTVDFTYIAQLSMDGNELIFLE